MTESEGQEPEDPQGQEPTPPQEGNPTPEVPGAPEDRVVSELRKEAAKYRTQVRDMEARLKEYEQAQLTEQERITAERDELRTLLDQATTRTQRLALESAVITAATRAGVIDPEVAVALVASQVVYDDDGLPVGVDELVASLVKERPYLANSAKTIPGAPAANPQRDRTAENGKRVYRASELNDRKFYETHRDDILAAISEGRIQED